MMLDTLRAAALPVSRVVRTTPRLSPYVDGPRSFRPSKRVAATRALKVDRSLGCSAVLNGLEVLGPLGGVRTLAPAAPL